MENEHFYFVIVASISICVFWFGMEKLCELRRYDIFIYFLLMQRSSLVNFFNILHLYKLRITKSKLFLLLKGYTIIKFVTAKSILMDFI